MHRIVASNEVGLNKHTHALRSVRKFVDMECREEENLLPKDVHDGVSKRSFKDMPTHEIMSAIQDLKQFVQEKVEDLNVRVERRLRKMENDIAAVVAHSSEAKQASHQGTLGRDESKLALESDKQTMEKHRKDHENMSQEEQKRVAAEAERQQANCWQSLSILSSTLSE